MYTQRIMHGTMLHSVSVYIIFYIVDLICSVVHRNLGTPESETTGFLHRVKISGVCKNILHRTVHSP